MLANSYNFRRNSTIHYDIIRLYTVAEIASSLDAMNDDLPSYKDQRDPQIACWSGLVDHGAIAVPSVTRCRCRCRRGHRLSLIHI